MRFSRFHVFALTTLLAVGLAVPLFGQPKAKGKPSKDEAERIAAAKKQEEIKNKYKKFEAALLTMANYLQKTNPHKADLIRQALAKSQSERIENRMAKIVGMLNKEEFSDAVEAQGELVGRLQGIFDLLQRESKLDSTRAEIKRIKEILADLKVLKNQEKNLRFKTDRGQGDPEQLAAIQAAIAQKTKELVQKIDAQDAARAGNQGNGQGKGKGGQGKGGKGKGGQGKGGQGKGGQGKGGMGKGGMGKGGMGKGGMGKGGMGKGGMGKGGMGKGGMGKGGMGKGGMGKGGMGKGGMGKGGMGKGGMGKGGMGKGGMGKGGMGKGGMGKGGMGKGGMGKGGMGKGGMGKGGMGKGGMGKGGMGKGGMGKGGQGKGGQGKGGGQQDPNQQPAPKTPGRDEIEAAQKAMERAIEELRKAKRDGASDKQAEAIENLEKAQAKLEEILKQLREEERELMLRALEARFALMLRMQKAIYNSTKALSVVPKSSWGAVQSEKTAGLAKDEDQIALEAEKALLLLKAEGSSIAFPEAVREVRDDMRTVARMLGKENVGRDTQDIERDIIDALSEMIEALKKEIEKAKKKKEKKKKGKPKKGKPKDKELVDKLAELKMLRSLQMRVNRRTRRLGNRIKGEQATKRDAEVVRQLRDLAKRQARIQKAAYDLATGRNQ